MLQLLAWISASGVIVVQTINKTHSITLCILKTASFRSWGSIKYKWFHVQSMSPYVSCRSKFLYHYKKVVCSQNNINFGTAHHFVKHQHHISIKSQHFSLCDLTAHILIPRPPDKRLWTQSLLPLTAYARRRFLGYLITGRVWKSFRDRLIA